MEEWLPAIDKLLKRRLTIYAYSNNHYQGAAFESARLFSETLDRTIVNRNAEIARPASSQAQDTNLF
jgi:uncharacterized protein YecE (DUF72 family)